MTDNKIIRTVCLFTKAPGAEAVQRVQHLADILSRNDFTVQTQRIVSPDIGFKEIEEKVDTPDIFCGLGTPAPVDETLKMLADGGMDEFLETGNVSFNLDLTDTPPSDSHVNVLFDIIKKKPAKTFNFTYVFNNPPSTPFFPAATYETEGFAVGLQPTDLAEDCATLVQWLMKTKTVWHHIATLLDKEKGFLGIDSSVAPLFGGSSSLIYFIKRLGMTLDQSVLTDTYLKISRFIKTANPCPVGLCGIMFPCLEDFELAAEYERGEFSIERNIFLSLHSGLGIDTYPIGIDEDPRRVKDILSVLRGLSNKYQKPLSARFVSDGKARIGEKTDFQNQYLKDVVIKKL